MSPIQQQIRAGYLINETIPLRKIMGYFYVQENNLKYINCISFDNSGYKMNKTKA